MEHWIGLEIQRRREDLYAQARQARAVRETRAVRRARLTQRVADGADALSVLLAGWAHALRKHEA